MLDLKSLYTIDLTNNKGETEITKCKLVNYNEDTDLYTVSPYGIGTVIENIEEDQLTSIEEDWHEITKRGKSLTITAQQGTPISCKIIIPLEQEEGEVTWDTPRKISYTTNVTIDVNGNENKIEFGRDSDGFAYVVSQGELDILNGELYSERDCFVFFTKNRIENISRPGSGGYCLYNLIQNVNKIIAGYDTVTLKPLSIQYSSHLPQAETSNQFTDTTHYKTIFDEFNSTGTGYARIRFRVKGSDNKDAVQTLFKEQLNNNAPVQFTFSRKDDEVGQARHIIENMPTITLQEGTNTLSTDVGEIEITYMGKE